MDIKTMRPFEPGATASLGTAGSSSTRIALGTIKGGPGEMVARIVCETNGACIKFGDSSVAATTSDMRMLAGTVELFTIPKGSTHLGIIRNGSADASVSVTTGFGS